METSEREAFGVLIGALLEAFGQESTTPRILGYWLGLSDLTIEQVGTAVERAIRQETGSFPPVPAKLREFAGGGSGEELALQAWNDLQKTMTVGAYSHVDFEDALINAAVRLLGGWVQMFEHCGNAAGEKWYRIEFTRTYTMLFRSGVNGDACRPLMGLSEASIENGKISAPRVMKISCNEDRKRIASDAVKIPESINPAAELVTFKTA